MNYTRICVKDIISRNRLHDIFGIGATVSSAANIGATAMTNAANKEIADQANETAIAIHESDKQFNAEQAQINREWNSEQAVVKRRQEAGLNVAVTGQNGSGGGITGGGSTSAVAPSAPQLQVPQMQAPDIGSMVDSAINLAKLPSDISQTKQNIKESEERAKNLEQQTENAKLQADFQRIINKYKPEEFRANIDSLISNIGLQKAQTELTDAERNQVLASVARTRFEITNGAYQMILQQQSNDLDAATIMQQRDLVLDQLKTEAAKLRVEGYLKMLDMSYKFGKFTSTQNELNKREGKEYGFGGSLGFGIEHTAEVKGLPISPIGAQIKSRFNANLNADVTNEITTETNRLMLQNSFLQNDVIMRKAGELTLIIDELEKATTAKSALPLLRKYGELNHYFSDYFKTMQFVDTMMSKRGNIVVPTVTP